MGKSLVAPPVLSTPDTRIADSFATPTFSTQVRSDEQLSVVYEIGRTIKEIKHGRWRRIALQFPDSLLHDAPRIFELLRDGLRSTVTTQAGRNNSESHESDLGQIEGSQPLLQSTEPKEEVFILGDTSYGACCVDEIAAEHVDADVVVHYGRACLSPTARLPVIHVFTIQDLPIDPLVQAFMDTHPLMSTKVILMADVTYVSHIPSIAQSLRDIGYINIFETSVKHDPISPIPNRDIPPEAIEEPAKLLTWSVFHIGSPPPALLLTLYSRVLFLRIYPTKNPSEPTQPRVANMTTALRRRYALLTRISRASIIGILINTLSVHAYREALAGTEARIIAAGKKAYIFAMGRLNTAKVSNFAEVDGWVVIGCWESSLVESREFQKPVVTPFELELALKGDEERIWTGEWRGDFGAMVDMEGVLAHTKSVEDARHGGPDAGDGSRTGGFDSEEESEPPEFDLRTGRYITRSMPMRRRPLNSSSNAQISEDGNTKSLAKRAPGDLAVVGGELSPGAQYLQEKRTWKGLGSDFTIAYEDESTKVATIEEGRSGIASGYVGEADVHDERRAKE